MFYICFRDINIIKIVEDILRMLRRRYVEYDDSKEEEYKECMKGGVISPARLQCEISKAESLELGLKAIRKAMSEG